MKNLSVIAAITAVGWLSVSGLALAENQEATDDLSISAQEECKPKAFVIPLPYKKGSAVAEEVLEGATFTNKDDVDIPGTMPNNGAMQFTPGPAYQTIPEGYHNGSGEVKGDVGLQSGNIKQGVTIFGVYGSSKQASGTATRNQVLVDQTFSNNYGAAIGTMPDHSSMSFMPGRYAISIPRGYFDGTGIVQGSIQLTPTNIVNGSEIFGVRGERECLSTPTHNEARSACHEWCDTAYDPPEYWPCVRGCDMALAEIDARIIRCDAF